MNRDPALTGYLKMFLKTDEVLEYAQGDTIFSEGDTGDVYYVILEGDVRLEIDAMPIRTAHAGEAFGEMALLDDSPRSASAIADSDCRLYPISAERFEEMVEQTPYFLRPMLELTLRRLRDSDQHVAKLLKAGPAVRLA
jgi:CRP-like cAMP-binding protein